MPAPNVRRSTLLKYLREGFPYEYDFIDWKKKTHSYDAMYAAVYQIKECDPIYMRTLVLHMGSRMKRTDMADALGLDQSTFKRKLDYAADCVAFFLIHSKLPPEKLFTNRDPFTGTVTQSRFPKTNFRTW